MDTGQHGYIRFGSSSRSKWISYTSFESFWWEDFKMPVVDQVCDVASCYAMLYSETAYIKVIISKEAVVAAKSWAIGNYCKRMAANGIGYYKKSSLPSVKTANGSIKFRGWRSHVTNMIMVRHNYVVLCQYAVWPVLTHGYLGWDMVWDWTIQSAYWAKQNFLTHVAHF